MLRAGNYCVLLGGGGHAKVLIECIEAEGKVEPYAILDADQTRWHTEVLGVPIVGGDQLLQSLSIEGCRYFAVGVGMAQNWQMRQRLYELGLSCNMEPLTIRHPQAICSKWTEIGPGSQFLPLSVVNPGTIIGKNVILNTGSIIEHDCILGDHVHVAPGALLAGNVRVGDGTHIGIGATVKQGVSIAEGAVVGAGAVVVKDVLPGAVVIGVPARPLTRP
jgi:sugar O-acyltransferase (sialic acid O-acetyltransferase NeuD family)